MSRKRHHSEINDELLVDETTTHIDRQSPTGKNIRDIVDMVYDNKFLPIIVDEAFQLIGKHVSTKTFNYYFSSKWQIGRFINVLFPSNVPWSIMYLDLKNKFPKLLPELIHFLHRKRIEQKTPASHIQQRLERQLVRSKRVSSIDATQERYNRECDIFSNAFNNCTSKSWPNAKHNMILVAINMVNEKTSRYQWMSLLPNASMSTPPYRHTKLMLHEKYNSCISISQHRTINNNINNNLIRGRQHQVLSQHSHRVTSTRANTKVVCLYVSNPITLSVPTVRIVNRKTPFVEIKNEYKVYEVSTAEEKNQSKFHLNLKETVKGYIKTENPLPKFPVADSDKTKINGVWIGRISNVLPHDVNMPMPFTKPQETIHRELARDSAIEFLRDTDDSTNSYHYINEACYIFQNDGMSIHHPYCNFKILLNSTNRYHKLMEMRQEELLSSQIDIISIVDIWQIIVEYQLVHEVPDIM